MANFCFRLQPNVNTNIALNMRTRTIISSYKVVSIMKIMKILAVVVVELVVVQVILLVAVVVVVVVIEAILISVVETILILVFVVTVRVVAQGQYVVLFVFFKIGGNLKPSDFRKNVRN